MHALGGVIEVLIEARASRLSLGCHVEHGMVSSAQVEPASRTDKYASKLICDFYQRLY